MLESVLKRVLQAVFGDGSDTGAVTYLVFRVREIAVAS